MYLIEYLREIWGVNLAEVARKLKIEHGTLSTYDKSTREMPLWRLVQIAQETGISWNRIGELLEKDYPRAKVQELLKQYKSKKR